MERWTCARCGAFGDPLLEFCSQCGARLETGPDGPLANATVGSERTPTAGPSSINDADTGRLRLELVTELERLQVERPKYQSRARPLPKSVVYIGNPITMIVLSWVFDELSPHLGIVPGWLQIPRYPGGPASTVGLAIGPLTAIALLWRHLRRVRTGQAMDRRISVLRIELA